MLGQRIFFTVKEWDCFLVKLSSQHKKIKEMSLKQEHVERNFKANHSIMRVKVTKLINVQFNVALYSLAVQIREHAPCTFKTAK